MLEFAIHAAHGISMSDHNWSSPFRLLPVFKERVWGRTDLRRWFADAPKATRIGEAWFTIASDETSAGMPLGQLLAAHPTILGDAADNRNPFYCPLLVKFLFTSDRLSVQVHPDDNYALRHHQALGKTEAWYVLEAEPGASVGLGFRETLSPERLRSAAESGEIEHLLNSRTVQAGDILTVPAGTVHSIGAGLAICEIQQNSDITYRLFDFGRDRELQLEHGCAVAHRGTYLPPAAPKALTPWRDVLADSYFFRIERLRIPGARLLVGGGLRYYLLCIAIAGSGTIAGQRCGAGDVWLVPAHAEAFNLEGAGCEWLVVYAGGRPNPQIDTPPE